MPKNRHAVTPGTTRCDADHRRARERNVTLTMKIGMKNESSRRHRWLVFLPSRARFRRESLVARANGVLRFKHHEPRAVRTASRSDRKRQARKRKPRRRRG